MNTMIKKITSKSKPQSSIYLFNKFEEKEFGFFDKNVVEYIKHQYNSLGKKTIILPDYKNITIIEFLINEKKEEYIYLEECRKRGDKSQIILNENKVASTVLIDKTDMQEIVIAYSEGMALGNYQFIKYKTKPEINTLKSIELKSNSVKTSEIKELNTLIESVYLCRDLINEPLTFLNAVKLSEIATEKGSDAGIKVEVFNKKKIESLRMGGLLAVNRGSIDPPTFTIMEWKPENRKNKNPIVLVGKGVVYDTGGVNIKPGDFMLDMKCDMGGAAAVMASLIAVAKAELPVHVIGLIPATDNRPDGNAYVPGDILRMFTGKTVEVMNTDAEGRLILADALGYASKYKPELVINIATLTGAASRAIGKYGIVAMQSKANDFFCKLKKSGENVYERLAEFPFWDEYSELIKSEVADIKNLGGTEAGMITAGKFLEEFTDYPFIHLDIAGPVFIGKKDSYRGKAATGVGVRLFFDFIKNYNNNSNQ